MRLGDLVPDLARSRSVARHRRRDGRPRRVAPGMLFAALKGARFDGTAFVGDALSRGAAAILVAEDARSLSTAGAGAAR